jgi:hypothetical protein
MSALAIGFSCSLFDQMLSIDCIRLSRPVAGGYSNELGRLSGCHARSRGGYSNELGRLQPRCNEAIIQQDVHGQFRREDLN